MRTTFYGMALAFLLVGLVAFATMPAVAQITSNQLMQTSATTVEHKGPVSNPGNTGFLSKANGGATEPARVNMKPAKMPAKPEEATVARVNRSGNCLNVYTKHSIFSKKMACLAKGKTIHLTGVFNKHKRWAQLDNKGWVLFRNLKMKNPRTAAKGVSWRRSAATGKGTSKNARYSAIYHELNSGPIF